MAVDYSLYLVTDRPMLNGRDLIDEVLKAVRGGVTLVQLREKDCSSREFYHLAAALKEALDKKAIPLIINDRLDIAMAVDADGLHIGQEDLPLNIVRNLLGTNKIIGVSASTLEEARVAAKQGASYLGIGPVYFTDTKKEIPQPTGIELLKEFRAVSDIPMVAIGGVTAESLPAIKKTGMDGAAVVSAILKENDVEKAAQRMIKQWQNA